MKKIFILVVVLTIVSNCALEDLFTTYQPYDSSKGNTTIEGYIGEINLDDYTLENKPATVKLYDENLSMIKEMSVTLSSGSSFQIPFDTRENLSHMHLTILVGNILIKAYIPTVYKKQRNNIGYVDVLSTTTALAPLAIA